MKGPFDTLDEARTHAEIGEYIMCRDQRKWAWCVMTEEGALFNVKRLSNDWSLWEKVDAKPSV